MSEQLRLFDSSDYAVGIFDLCSTASVNSTPLTEEDLRAAFRAVTDDTRIHPCKLGRHLVSVRGKDQLKRGGRAICHECGNILGPYSSI